MDTEGASQHQPADSQGSGGPDKKPAVISGGGTIEDANHAVGSQLWSYTKEEELPFIKQLQETVSQLQMKLQTGTTRERREIVDELQRTLSQQEEGLLHKAPEPDVAELEAELQQLRKDFAAQAARTEKAENHLSALEEELQLERSRSEASSVERQRLASDFQDAQEKRVHAEKLAAAQQVKSEWALRQASEQVVLDSRHRDQALAKQSLEKEEQLELLLGEKEELSSKCAAQQQMISTLEQEAQDREAELDEARAETARISAAYDEQERQTQREIEELRTLFAERPLPPDEVPAADARNLKMELDDDGIRRVNSDNALQDEMEDLRSELEDLCSKSQSLAQENQKLLEEKRLWDSSTRPEEGLVAQHLQIDQLRRQREELESRCELQVQQGKVIMDEALKSYLELKDLVDEKEQLLRQQAADIERMQSDIEAFSITNATQKQLINDLELRPSGHEGQIVSLQASVEASQNTLTIQTQRMQDTEQQLRDSQGRCSELSAKVARLQKASESFKQQSKQAGTNLEAELSTLRNANRMLSRELEAQIVMVQDAEALKRQLLEMEAENSSLQPMMGQLELLQQAHELLSSQHAALQSNFESMRLQQEATGSMQANKVSETDWGEVGILSEMQCAFKPSVLVYDCMDDVLGLCRIIRIQVPGRHLDDDDKPGIKGTIQPLANGVSVTLTKESDIPDMVQIVSQLNFSDPVGSWEWRYEPTDGIWTVCKCWGLAHGVLALALAKAPDGEVCPVEDSGLLAKSSIASLPSKVTRKQSTKASVQKSGRKAAQTSGHFAMFTISGDASASNSEAQLLRDMVLISEDGAIIQAADLSVGMRVQGPEECAEVRSIKWVDKKEEKVLTLYTGVEGVTVLADQVLTAAAYTEDGTATLDWSQLLAGQLLAGRHDLALHSSDGLQQGAAITGVRRFVRSTALIKVEFEGSRRVFVGLQSAMPKPAPVASAPKRQTFIQQGLGGSLPPPVGGRGWH